MFWRQSWPSEGSPLSLIPAHGTRVPMREAGPGTMQGRTQVGCHREFSTLETSWKGKASSIPTLGSFAEVIPQWEFGCRVAVCQFQALQQQCFWISLRFEQGANWHSSALLQWKIIALQSEKCSGVLPLKPKGNILKCQHGLLLISFKWESWSKVFTTISNWLPCILSCQKSLPKPPLPFQQFLHSRSGLPMQNSASLWKLKRWGYCKPNQIIN